MQELGSAVLFRKFLCQFQFGLRRQFELAFLVVGFAAELRVFLQDAEIQFGIRMVVVVSLENPPQQCRVPTRIAHDRAGFRVVVLA